MLDISGINGHVPQELRALVNDLRRAHTSPVTIHVVMHGYNVLNFYDERFPESRENTQRIATLHYSNGEFALRSFRIKNAKFRPGSNGFNDRVTKDARKMQKLLRQYIYPLTIQEIMDTTEGIKNEYNSWVERPSREMGPAMGAMSYQARIAVMEEMEHMRAIGMHSFKTPMFNRLFREALPLHDEFKRRSALKVQHMHVYIEPDGRVVVTIPPSGTATERPSGETKTYMSMSEVPENIQQQISMLKLVEKGQYVPEVGQRMADDIYWVHIIDTP